MADKMTAVLDAAWMPSGRLTKKCQHFREGRANPKMDFWESEIPESSQLADLIEFVQASRA